MSLVPKNYQAELRLELNLKGLQGSLQVTDLRFGSLQKLCA